jgi:quinol monooxygenase YgiN
MNRRDFLSNGLVAAASIGAGGKTDESIESSAGKLVGVLAELTFAQGAGEQGAAALARLATETRKEPGCLRYVVARDMLDPDRFHLSELWDGVRSLADHFATPHMTAFSATARGLGFAAPFIKQLSIADLKDLRPGELKAVGERAINLKGN